MNSYIFPQAKQCLDMYLNNFRVHKTNFILHTPSRVSLPLYISLQSIFVQQLDSVGTTRSNNND